MADETLIENTTEINPTTEAKRALDGILAAQATINALALGHERNLDFDGGLSPALRNAATMLTPAVRELCRQVYA